MKHEWARSKVDGQYEAAMCINCLLIIAAMPNFKGLKKGESIYYDKFNIVVFSDSELTDNSLNMLIKKYNLNCN